jgi:hypothetical protein
MMICDIQSLTKKRKKHQPVQPVERRLATTEWTADTAMDIPVTPAQ